MSQIGSFALLLALALCTYSFLAGLLALVIKGSGSERLGETARRAGIASFAIVFLAAVVLVVCSLSERLLHRLHLSPQQSRSSRTLQVRHALVRTRRIAAVLGFLLSAYGFVLGSAIKPIRVYLPTLRSSSPRSGLLLIAAELRRESFA
jgi:cytochrome c-type biogenesis protein CcmF